MKLVLPKARRIRTGSATLFSCAIPDTVTKLYRAILEKSPDELQVTIEPVKRKRSTGYASQNHRLNGFIQQICEATGNDFDMIKMVVKYRAIDRGYPFITLDTGDRYPQSESDASVEECAILIQAVEQLAAEEGIALVE